MGQDHRLPLYTPPPTLQTDTFILKGPDVGEPEYIRIRSSGTGMGAPWHLAQVRGEGGGEGKAMIRSHMGRVAWAVRKHA